MSTTSDWNAISIRARQSVLEAIPLKWRLPEGYEKPLLNLQRVARECGIMTERQLELTDLTASELIPRIVGGELTAAEVTEGFCALAAIAQQLVNCLTDFFPQEAIEIAKSVDREFSKTGKIVGPLHGLPIAIKDTFDVKGKRTTVGCVAWYDSPMPDEDAALVRVMRDSGAIIFARTTMPQTGMALETVSPLFGRTLNPYNSKFGAGGSSGGDGALVAMHGAPCAPLSTDIGGSIRAPAAFNGLYGMRPSSERVARTGLASTKLGLVSIKSSCGPCCHNMSDLKLLTKLVLTHLTIPHEPCCIPGFWNQVSPKAKLAIGIMVTDGVVDPHPPVTRALKEVASKLRAAGHDVIEFKPPVDLWQAALTTWALYFQTGAKEIKAALAASGEPPIAQFQHNLDVFQTRELAAAEIFKCHNDQLAYKAAFVKAWDATINETSTRQPIDCIICPSATMAGSPHDFPLWWGYTTIWNLIDYPSIIMPIESFKIDPIRDAKVLNYKPRDNPFDKPNWDICEVPACYDRNNLLI
jgi:amidase